MILNVKKNFNCILKMFGKIVGVLKLFRLIEGGKWLLFVFVLICSLCDFFKYWVLVVIVVGVFWISVWRIR